jgi:hypothetical protein
MAVSSLDGPIPPGERIGDREAADPVAVELELRRHTVEARADAARPAQRAIP